MTNHPNRSTVGRPVRNRLTGQIGELTRGPRRAGAGMVWVLWREGSGRPVLANRVWIERLDAKTVPSQSDD